jgi:hypothetical protein
MIKGISPEIEQNKNIHIVKRKTFKMQTLFQAHTIYFAGPQKHVTAEKSPCEN